MWGHGTAGAAPEAEDSGALGVTGRREAYAMSNVDVTELTKEQLFQLIAAAKRGLPRRRDLRS
jgi:hypothetical protein